MASRASHIESYDVTFAPDGNVWGPVHVISHESALYLRRRLFSDNEFGEPGANACAMFLHPAPRLAGLGAASCPQERSYPKEFDRLAAAQLIENPVHVLVAWQSRRRVHREGPGVRFATHLWTGALPEGALDELVFTTEFAGDHALMPSAGPVSAQFEGANIFCSSMPFVYAQLSREGSEVELARLACEMCGEYSLAPWRQQGFVAHEPELTCNDLLDFLARLGWANGSHEKAERGVKLAADGSKSPLETCVYLLLCLPPRLGGYGLPKPLLNPWLQSDGSIAGAGGPEVRGPLLRPDLYWESVGLDVEVHGYGPHFGKSAKAEGYLDDISREGYLKRLGVDVYPITIRDIRNLDAMDGLARYVLQRLKDRRKKLPSGAKWRERQAKLRGILVP